MRRFRLLRPLIASSCLAVLAGCMTPYDTIDLDRTTRGYHIYCSGMPYALNSDCHDRAARICEDVGYTVLKERDTTYPHTQWAWDMATHDIIIKCNHPNKTNPTFQAPVSSLEIAPEVQPAMAAPEANESTEDADIIVMPEYPHAP